MSKLISKDDFIKLFDNYDITISDSDYSRFEAYADLLPSCPLKIVRDDIKLTLLDSLNKRINFLAQLSDSLDLGATCIHGRAEELGRSMECREQFDIATARAVANLSDLCEYCLPFVKVGGYFVLYKVKSAKSDSDFAADKL